MVHFVFEICQSFWRLFADSINIEKDRGEITATEDIGYYDYRPVTLCLHVSSVSNAMFRARANLRPHLQYNCKLNQVKIRYQIIRSIASLPKNALIAL